MTIMAIDGGGRVYEPQPSNQNKPAAAAPTPAPAPTAQQQALAAAKAETAALLQQAEQAMTTLRQMQDKGAKQSDIDAQVQKAGLAWGAVQAAAENQMRITIDGGGDAKKALATASADLQALAPNDQMLNYVVTNAQQTVAPETPTQRATNEQAFQFAEAVQQDPTAGSSATMTPAEQKASDGLHAALLHEFNVQAATLRLNDAKADYAAWLHEPGRIRRAEERDVDDELGQAQSQYDQVMAGNDKALTYVTPDEQTQATALVTAAHQHDWFASPTDDGNGGTQPSMIATVAAQSQLQRDVANVNPDDPTLSPQMKQLAQTDPVTFALLQETGQTVDPNAPGLSKQEQTLAQQNPLAEAFVKLTGVDVDPKHMTKAQQSQFNQGIFQYAITNADKKSPHYALIQTLMAVAPTVRLQYTQDTVNALMKDPSHNASAALAVLNANMDATFSTSEREAMWNQVGAPHFNDQFIQSQIAPLIATPDRTANDPDSVRARNDNTMNADKIGKWMQGILTNAPPEFAGVMVNSVEHDFNDQWTESNTGTPALQQGVEFYKGLSQAVGLADQQPTADGKPLHLESSVAAWLLDPKSNAQSMINMLRGNSTSYGFDSIRQTVGGGFDPKLSQALLNQMETSPRYQSNFAIDFQMMLTQGLSKAQKAQNSVYANASYNLFQSMKPAQTLQPYFNDFKANYDNKAHQFTAGSNQLTNFIGTGLAMQPDDPANVPTDANDNPSMGMLEQMIIDNAPAPDGNGPINSASLYKQNQAATSMINTVTSEIQKYGGDHPVVTLVPTYYVSQDSGASPSALFKVQNKDDPSKFTYIDDRGWEYNDLSDYQHNNALSDGGTLYVPDNLSMSPSAKGAVQYQPVAAHITTGWQRVETVLEFGVGILATAAGVVLVVSGVGSPLAIAAWAVTGSAMGFGAYTSISDLNNLSAHGQSTGFGNAQARGDWISLIGTGAGVVSGGFGAASKMLTDSAGLLRSLDAASTSLGNDASFVNDANAFQSVADLSGTASKVTGFIGAGSGIDLSGEQGISLLKNWDSMSASERGQALFSFGLGAVQFGASLPIAEAPISKMFGGPEQPAVVPQAPFSNLDLSAELESAEPFGSNVIANQQRAADDFGDPRSTDDGDDLSLDGKKATGDDSFDVEANRQAAQQQRGPLADLATDDGNLPGATDDAPPESVVRAAATAGAVPDEEPLPATAAAPAGPQRASWAIPPEVADDAPLLQMVVDSAIAGGSGLDGVEYYIYALRDEARDGVLEPEKHGLPATRPGNLLEDMEAAKNDAARAAQKVADEAVPANEEPAAQKGASAPDTIADDAPTLKVTRYTNLYDVDLVGLKGALDGRYGVALVDTHALEPDGSASPEAIVGRYVLSDSGVGKRLNLEMNPAFDHELRVLYPRNFEPGKPLIRGENGRRIDAINELQGHQETQWAAYPRREADLTVYSDNPRQPENRLPNGERPVLPVPPGHFAVYAHAWTDAFADSTGAAFGAEDMAARIRAAGWDGESPVILYSCGAGMRASPLAQLLASVLGVDVYGATGFVAFRTSRESGFTTRIEIEPHAYGRDGVPDTSVLNGARVVRFMPGLKVIGQDDHPIDWSSIAPRAVDQTWDSVTPRSQQQARAPLGVYLWNVLTGGGKILTPESGTPATAQEMAAAFNAPKQSTYAGGRAIALDGPGSGADPALLQEFADLMRAPVYGRRGATDADGWTRADPQSLQRVTPVRQALDDGGETAGDTRPPAPLPVEGEPGQNRLASPTPADNPQDAQGPAVDPHNALEPFVFEPDGITTAAEREQIEAENEEPRTQKTHQKGSSAYTRRDLLGDRTGVVSTLANGRKPIVQVGFHDVTGLKASQHPDFLRPADTLLVPPADVLHEVGSNGVMSPPGHHVIFGHGISPETMQGPDGQPISVDEVAAQVAPRLADGQEVTLYSCYAGSNKSDPLRTAGTQYEAPDAQVFAQSLAQRLAEANGRRTTVWAPPDILMVGHDGTATVEITRLLTAERTGTGVPMKAFYGDPAWARGATHPGAGPDTTYRAGNDAAAAQTTQTTQTSEAPQQPPTPQVRNLPLSDPHFNFSRLGDNTFESVALEPDFASALKDRPGVLGEVARVTRPGGTVSLDRPSGFLDEPDPHAVIEATLQAFVDGGLTNPRAMFMTGPDTGIDLAAPGVDIGQFDPEAGYFRFSAQVGDDASVAQNAPASAFTDLPENDGSLRHVLDPDAVERNLDDAIDRSPFRDVSWHESADELPELGVHRFVLQDSFADERGIHPGASIALPFTDPSETTRALAQDVASVTGVHVFATRPDAPTEWEIFTPQSMHGNFEGPIEFDAASGTFHVVGEDGSHRPIVPEDHLGSLRGMGVFKTAIQFGNKTLIIYRDIPTMPGEGVHFERDVPADMIATTRQLEALGAPHFAKIDGVTQIFGLDALVMDSYRSADREFMKAGDIGIRTHTSVFDTTLLNERSIESLTATKNWLVDQQVEIKDLQFLVRADGTFDIADVEKIVPDTPPEESTLRKIDHYIALAQARLARSTVGEDALAQAFETRQQEAPPDYTFVSTQALPDVSSFVSLQPHERFAALLEANLDAVRNGPAVPMHRLSELGYNTASKLYFDMPGGKIVKPAGADMYVAQITDPATGATSLQLIASDASGGPQGYEAVDGNGLRAVGFGEHGPLWPMTHQVNPAAGLDDDTSHTLASGTPVPAVTPGQERAANQLDSHGLRTLRRIDGTQTAKLRSLATKAGPGAYILVKMHDAAPTVGAAHPQPKFIATLATDRYSELGDPQPLPGEAMPPSLRKALESDNAAGRTARADYDFYVSPVPAEELARFGGASKIATANGEQSWAVEPSNARIDSSIVKHIDALDNAPSFKRPQRAAATAGTNQSVYAVDVKTGEVLGYAVRQPDGTWKYHEITSQADTEITSNDLQSVFRRRKAGISYGPAGKRGVRFFVSKLSIDDVSRVGGFPAAEDSSVAKAAGRPRRKAGDVAQVGIGRASEIASKGLAKLPGEHNTKEPDSGNPLVELHLLPAPGEPLSAIDYSGQNTMHLFRLIDMNALDDTHHIFVYNTDKPLVDVLHQDPLGIIAMRDGKARWFSTRNQVRDPNEPGRPPDAMPVGDGPHGANVHFLLTQLKPGEFSRHVDSTQLATAIAQKDAADEWLQKVSSNGSTASKDIVDTATEHYEQASLLADKLTQHVQRKFGPDAIPEPLKIEPYQPALPSTTETESIQRYGKADLQEWLPTIGHVEVLNEHSGRSNVYQLEFAGDPQAMMVDAVLSKDLGGKLWVAREVSSTPSRNAPIPNRTLSRRYSVAQVVDRRMTQSYVRAKPELQDRVVPMSRAFTLRDDPSLMTAQIERHGGAMPVVTLVVDPYSLAAALGKQQDPEFLRQVKALGDPSTATFDAQQGIIKAADPGKPQLALDDLQHLHKWLDEASKTGFAIRLEVGPSRALVSKDDHRFVAGTNNRYDTYVRTAGTLERWANDHPDSPAPQVMVTLPGWDSVLESVPGAGHARLLDAMLDRPALDWVHVGLSYGTHGADFIGNQDLTTTLAQWIVDHRDPDDPQIARLHGADALTRVFDRVSPQRLVNQHQLLFNEVERIGRNAGMTGEQLGALRTRLYEGNTTAFLNRARKATIEYASPAWNDSTNPPRNRTEELARDVAKRWMTDIGAQVNATPTITQSSGSVDPYAHWENIVADPALRNDDSKTSATNRKIASQLGADPIPVKDQAAAELTALGVQPAVRSSRGRKQSGVLVGGVAGTGTLAFADKLFNGGRLLSGEGLRHFTSSTFVGTRAARVFQALHQGAIASLKSGDPDVFDTVVDRLERGLSSQLKANGFDAARKKQLSQIAWEGKFNAANLRADVETGSLTFSEASARTRVIAADLLAQMQGVVGGSSLKQLHHGSPNHSIGLFGRGVAVVGYTGTIALNVSSFVSHPELSSALTAIGASLSGTYTGLVYLGGARGINAENRSRFLRFTSRTSDWVTAAAGTTSAAAEASGHPVLAAAGFASSSILAAGRLHTDLPNATKWMDRYQTTLLLLPVGIFLGTTIASYLSSNGSSPSPSGTGPNPAHPAGQPTGLPNTLPLPPTPTPTPSMTTPTPTPAPHSTPTPAPSNPPQTYTVKNGDSLWSIAESHRPSLLDAAHLSAAEQTKTPTDTQEVLAFDEILQLNPQVRKDPALIYPEQKIIIG
ncbi:LWXIA domain-containing protein [Paraburkholderia megapolitana]|uniref:LWXIA domain-containing protein n=1 Tax=Paraburkholderia megapolitana TaxID=420953 RepID=UPI0038BDB80F